MSNIVYVRDYTRRRPEKRPEYRAIHNRLYDEVMFLQACDRQLEDELALSMAHEFEMREVGLWRE